MSFNNITVPSLHPEQHLENYFISNKDPIALRKYDDYYNLHYPEKDILLLEEFYSKCESFFSQNKKFHGLNKQGEECILGFTLSYYDRGGCIYEPIIYKFDKLEVITDYKRMGMNREDASEYQTGNFDTGKYKRLENILFIFADSQNYLQFNFHEKNLCNEKNLKEMNIILRNTLLKNTLDIELPINEDNRKRVKI